MGSKSYVVQAAPGKKGTENTLSVGPEYMYVYIRLICGLDASHPAKATDKSGQRW